jgi:hypothetical protein
VAEHVWSVACRTSLIDPNTQLISLIEVAEKITLQSDRGKVDVQIGLAQERSNKGVVTPIQMQIVSWWVRSNYDQPESAEGRISLIDPAGSRLFEQPLPIDLLSVTARRFTVNLDQFPLTALGLYWFLVEQKHLSKSKKPRWTTETRIPLEMVGGDPLNLSLPSR